jgi:predicted dinucleotide-utilizing enzyme
MSYSTIQQIFQAQKIAYISGNKEKRFITITKFKIMKSDYLEAQKELKKLNAKNSLLLTPEERQRMEQLQAIAKTDLVIECYDSELLTEEQATSLQNKDEFIILSIGDLRGEADKLKNQLFAWEVAIKSPRIGEILGIFETTGES